MNKQEIKDLIEDTKEISKIISKYIVYILCIIIILYWSGFNTRNVEDIKLHSKEVLENNGYKITGYQGYQIGNPQLWGGIVYYNISSIPDNGVKYDCGITKWFNEYQIWSLRAIDAIKPEN